MKASVQIVIDRPIDKVWAFVADVKNMEGWVAGVTEVTVTSLGAFGVGSTFTSEYSYQGRTTDVSYEVVEWRPPEWQVVRSASGPLPFRGSIEIETVAERTRLTHIVEAGPDRVGARLIFAVFGPLIRAGMRRQLRQELRLLKYLVERP